MNEPRRFVVLRHDHPVLHWDLMLDAGEALRTWRLAEAPQPGVAIRVEPLADHRRTYLDYEGPVSGGRGTVVRWDAGTYGELRETADAVTAIVDGERIKGTITIQKPDDKDGWVFLYCAVERTGD